MNKAVSRRNFLQSAGVATFSWLANRCLARGDVKPPRLAAVNLPEQMDHERLAFWKRAPRLPVLASDDAITSRILLAIREERTIDFGYHGGPAADGAPRTICPGAVFVVEGFEATYVSGYCFARRQERTFCIERMTFPG